MLESKLSENQLFLEFDKIPKSKSNANFATAQLNENAQLNRFKDVLPYEDNRVRLTSSRDNKYGYVNASHITVSELLTLSVQFRKIIRYLGLSWTKTDVLHCCSRTKQRTATISLLAMCLGSGSLFDNPVEFRSRRYGLFTKL